MTYKIKSVTPLPDLILSIQFSEAVTKHHDMKLLFEKHPTFNPLQKHLEMYYSVTVSTDRHGVIWNDDIGISCDELFFNGTTVKTLFDGLIASSDATQLWGLNESTLRKAITYGKLFNGQDVCKFCKQLVISYEAMKRKYVFPNQKLYSFCNAYYAVTPTVLPVFSSL